ncbi:MAG TPA: chloride channel protein [Woeseiaceae bacterium]|nr:chloride channel protein [Woeseiaceae bacterium]
MLSATRKDGRGALKVIGVAASIGAASGTAAILFAVAVEQVQRLLFAGGAPNLHTIAAGLPWWQVLLAPAAGGLAIGLFVDRFLAERRPHGVADVIEAAALRGGYISSGNGVAAAAVNAASLGCGASVGREGPVVHLGAMLGSWIARKAQIPPGRFRRLIGCGVAAGVAASFNAPIAGAVFAIEVVVGKYTLHTFAPIAVSTIVGTSLSRLYYGRDPAFRMPTHATTSLGEIPIYAVLGILAAAVAVAFILSVGLAQTVFRRARLARRFRPAAAGLAVGAIAIAVPQVLGVGYEATSEALHEALSLKWLIIILLAKLVASGISLGGGFGGGVFSPSLFLGAMAGGAFGDLVELVYPAGSAGYSAYTVVGMAAVAGAVLGAPLSTTLIVFEMTGDYALTLAVLLATIISSVLVNDFWGRTFFQWQMEERGIDLTSGHIEQLARQVRVGELVRREVQLLPDNVKGREALAALKAGVPVYVVAAADQRYVGTLNYDALLHTDLAKATATDLARTAPALRASDTLASAVTKSGLEEAIAFPVLSDDDTVIGFVTVRQIMNAWQGILDRVAREERSFGD